MTQPRYLPRVAGRWLVLTATVAACLLALSGCPLGPAPAEGRYVDVGGYYLFHIDTGVPPTPYGGRDPVTVIFISGLGSTLEVWNKVQPEVATFARTLSYDRGGTGWSDDGSDPRTGTMVAAELHNLLVAAQIPGPYVLVAHSVAGVYARLFATAYANRVAGIVLIDTRHEDAAKRQALVLSPKAASQLDAIFRLSVPFTTSQTGFLGEYLNFENTSEEIHANREIPPVPLIFLGPDKEQTGLLGMADADAEQSYELLTALVQDQVALSPLGEYRQVENATHSIQESAPETVVQAIRDVLDRAAQN